MFTALLKPCEKERVQPFSAATGNEKFCSDSALLHSALAQVVWCSLAPVAGGASEGSKNK